ncbi:MAG: hypothetical protein ABSE04_04300 [Candidatus Microgenomates bacterium]|jgi:hypothetical protein
MSSKEALLGALVRPKIEEIKDKLKYWGQGIELPEGETWTVSNSLTLEKFLEMNPVPDSPEDTIMYGIAWEFIWGEKPPDIVTKAREKLLERALSREKLEPLENLWLKLITVDTDLF